ncbi:unnamed protein product [Knipowitschia caucasica]
MCPATVSAAALWLLVLLYTGLLPAQASDFNQCSHSFYRHIPPQGSYDKPLQPLCLTRPKGQSFATLYQPSCDSAVYSAFHLSNGLTASTAKQEAESLSKEEKSVKVVTPALLKGDSDEPELSPAASHLQRWDSAVTNLVQSSIAPQCQILGGDLYVLIGAGRLGVLEAEDCQRKLLWSAVCCAAPDGKDSSSVALIRETEGELRQVSVKELEDTLGVTELFSEGCGAGGEIGGDISEVSHNDAQAVVNAVASDLGPVEETEAKEVTTRASNPIPDTAVSSNTEVSHKKTESNTESHVSSEIKVVVTESAKNAQVSPGSREVASSEPTLADPSLSPETVEEVEVDENSTSTVLYILSTTLSLLKAALHPVMSTLTELPGKVSYVLQEDLGVLSALPGDTYSVFHLLFSDIFSWVGSAFDLVYGVVEACFSQFYFVTSSMGEALFDSCYTGVTGIGILAGDTWGIFGDMLDNSWWATKVFGGRLAEQSGDYVRTVVGELGGQAGAVGHGFGKLAWKSGSGVGTVFKIVWRIVMGVLDTTGSIVGLAFEHNSYTSEETFDLSAAVLPEKN